VLKLTKEGQENAKQFICEQARPLEQRLFAYHFESGSAEDVLEELAEFQNADGGFGNALESDVRLPDSSAIATTVGLEILREVKATEANWLVKGAIRYLVESYDAELESWIAVPEKAVTAPHAPWWGFDEYPPERWNGCVDNPRPLILGYLFEYGGLVQPDLRETVAKAAMSRLPSLPEKMQADDVGCYAALAGMKAAPREMSEAIVTKLRNIIDQSVTRDPAQWGGYSFKPLKVITSPDSPFAESLKNEIELNLDYEMERQREDGCWAPNWSWGDAFPEAWKEAEKEWKGVLTVKTLVTLRNFGRLE
jgi:hypothetical protein